MILHYNTSTQKEFKINLKSKYIYTKQLTSLITVVPYNNNK